MSDAVFKRMSEVKAEEVRWLWDGRIPLGKVTLLEGQPGVGKSTLALDLAARVSRGNPLPLMREAELPPSNVVVFSGDDALADTVPTQAGGRRGRPRADLRRRSRVRPAGRRHAPARPDRPRHPLVLPQPVRRGQPRRRRPQARHPGQGHRRGGPRGLQHRRPGRRGPLARLLRHAPLRPGDHPRRPRRASALDLEVQPPPHHRRPPPRLLHPGHHRPRPPRQLVRRPLIVASTDGWEMGDGCCPSSAINHLSSTIFRAKIIGAALP